MSHGTWLGMSVNLVGLALHDNTPYSQTLMGKNA